MPININGCDLPDHDADNFRIMLPSYLGNINGNYYIPYKANFLKQYQNKILFLYFKFFNFSSSLRIFSEGMTFIFDYYIQNPAQVTGYFYLEVAYGKSWDGAKLHPNANSYIWKGVTLPLLSNIFNFKGFQVKRKKIRKNSNFSFLFLLKHLHSSTLKKQITYSSTYFACVENQMLAILCFAYTTHELYGIHKNHL